MLPDFFQAKIMTDHCYSHQLGIENRSCSPDTLVVDYCRELDLPIITAVQVVLFGHQMMGLWALQHFASPLKFARVSKHL